MEQVKLIYPEEIVVTQTVLVMIENSIVHINFTEDSAVGIVIY